jgi:hypothetical protein
MSNELESSSMSVHPKNRPPQPHRIPLLPAAPTPTSRPARHHSPRTRADFLPMKQESKPISVPFPRFGALRTSVTSSLASPGEFSSVFLMTASPRASSPLHEPRKASCAPAPTNRSPSRIARLMPQISRLMRPPPCGRRNQKKMALIYSPFIRFFNHILLTNKRIHKIASPDSAQSVVHCTADYAIQDPLPAFCGCKPHQHR